MSDDKPPTQRLGRLASGVGKSKDGGRLGSLRGDGTEAGTSAGASGSGLLSKFKPKNFNKAEQGPVPETKLAEPLPNANARRSSRNNRPTRGGRGGAGAPGGSRANYESEVVFGGIVGAGAVGKTDMRSKVEPEFKPEPPSPITTTQKPTKRLVKASGARAGAAGASGSKQKKDLKSESDTESLSSATDEDNDEDSDQDGTDEYLPTLLSALGKTPPEGASGSGALVSLVPEELMSRPVEDETELNRQLSWLTEPIIDNPGLVLFQLPSVLPIPVPQQSNGVTGGIPSIGGSGKEVVDLTGNGAGAAPSTSAAAAAAAAIAADGRPASLAELPPGKIGKLLVLRNGSVKMQIGEVLFDVSPGIPCQMLQEFAAVDSSSKTITMLGEIEKRIVVTPNIDSLLSDDPLPEWKYATENKNGVSGAVNGRSGTAAGKKKKNAPRGAVLIESSEEEEEEEEKEDEEMVDAENGTEKNGVVAMSDDEETEDEKEVKKKSRPQPKARGKDSQRTTRK